MTWTERRGVSFFTIIGSTFALLVANYLFSSPSQDVLAVPAVIPPTASPSSTPSPIVTPETTLIPTAKTTTPTKTPTIIKTPTTIPTVRPEFFFPTPTPLPDSPKIAAIYSGTDKEATNFFAWFTGGEKLFRENCPGKNITISPGQTYPLKYDSAQGITHFEGFSPTTTISMTILSAAGNQAYYSGQSQHFPKSMYELLQTDPEKFMEADRILTAIHEPVHACIQTERIITRGEFNSLVGEIGVPQPLPLYQHVGKIVLRGFSIDLYDDSNNYMDSVNTSTEEAITEWITKRLARQSFKTTHIRNMLQKFPSIYEGADDFLNKINDDKLFDNIVQFKKNSDPLGLYRFLVKNSQERLYLGKDEAEKMVRNKIFLAPWQ